MHYNPNKWARVDLKKDSHLSQIKALKYVNSPPLIVLVHPLSIEHKSEFGSKILHSPFAETQTCI